MGACLLILPGRADRHWIRAAIRRARGRDIAGCAKGLTPRFAPPLAHLVPNANKAQPTTITIAMPSNQATGVMSGFGLLIGGAGAPEFCWKAPAVEASRADMRALGERKRRRPFGASAEGGRICLESRSGSGRPHRRRSHSPSLGDYAMTGVSRQENVRVLFRPRDEPRACAAIDVMPTRRRPRRMARRPAGSAQFSRAARMAMKRTGPGKRRA